MKSIFYGAIIACSALFLTGCDEFSDTQQTRWLSTTEKAVYKTWYKTNTGSADTAIMNVARDRQRRNELPKADTFFCDAVVPMRIVEEEMKALGNKQTLSSIYKNVTGKDACFVLGAENTKEKDVLDDLIADARKSYDNVQAAKQEFAEAQKDAEALKQKADALNPIADVDTLKKLVEAAKDCNTAKVRSIMSGNDLNSIRQNDATNIIRECEVYKLQVELNK